MPSMVRTKNGRLVYLGRCAGPPPFHPFTTPGLVVPSLAGRTQEVGLICNDRGSLILFSSNTLECAFLAARAHMCRQCIAVCFGPCRANVRPVRPTHRRGGAAMRACVRRATRRPRWGRALCLHSRRDHHVPVRYAAARRGTGCWIYARDAGVAWCRWWLNSDDA